MVKNDSMIIVKDLCDFYHFRIFFLLYKKDISISGCNQTYLLFYIMEYGCIIVIIMNVFHLNALSDVFFFHSRFFFCNSRISIILNSF